MALLLPIVCLGDGARRVTFEEVGEYTDGRMAVALLVVGETVYLCEFDQGVVILDVSDPADIVEIGRLPNTAQSRGIAIVDGSACLSDRAQPTAL